MSERLERVERLRAQRKRLTARAVNDARRVPVEERVDGVMGSAEFARLMRGMWSTPRPRPRRKSALTTGDPHLDLAP